MATVAFAQQKTISGSVKDSNGAPLIGAAVLVLGDTSTGVTTDIDGNYSISVAPSVKALQFSYLGMVSQDVELGQRTAVDVVLQDEFMSLDDIVVIGFGAVRKKELTGAVTHVKADDISDVVTSDLGTALQGKVAGLNITQAGAPGESSEILIRGVASLNGDNTPLYVVDGVPQNGDPRIASNEIEQIDILKDAASCAIYGTRGAAGVILITTKRGKAGELKVSFDASYGIRKITSGVELMNTAEQGYFMFAQGRLQGAYDDEYTPDFIKNEYSMQYDTDLFESVVINNAATQTYALNVTGGGENATYNVVAGYYDEEGVILNSGFNRFNTRANMSYNKGKWSIFSSLGITLEEKISPNGNIIPNLISYYPYFEDISSDDDDLDIQNGENFSRVNWVVQSFNKVDNTKTTKTFANTNISYEIIKDLKLSTRLGMSTSNMYRHEFMPFQELYDMATGEIITDPKTSYVSNSTTRGDSFTWETTLNYKKSFGDHNVAVMGSFSLEEYNYTGFYARRYDVSNNNIESLNGATGDQIASSYNETENKMVGMIGRVQYDWKSRYLFSANIRRDGSSKFAPANRWGVFPSVSAAWNISDEPFWEGAKDVVNNFKFRASYGTTGNQGFSPYTYSSTMKQDYDYVFGTDASGILGYGTAVSGYSNEFVQWETSVQTNLGIDVYFLNNKFTLTAEVYDTQKKDMLFPVTLPTSTGTSESVTLNIGNMVNRGAELALGYNDSFGEVDVTMGATFSKNVNEISQFDLLEGIVYNSNGWLVNGAVDWSKCTGMAAGYPAGGFFLYKTDGICDTAERLADYQKIDPSAGMGDTIRVDTNGDGKLTADDKVFSGSGLADFEFGYNLSMNWRNWDFSMSWYASIGHELMNGSAAMAYTYGRGKDLLYMWTEQNPVTSIPSYRGTLKQDENYLGDLDLWMEDGSYLRLKSITLGYTLPKNILSKVGLSKLRVYVSAQNPLTITSYSGYDPEVGGSIAVRGLDRGNYPISSLYTAGVNINL